MIDDTAHFAHERAAREHREKYPEQYMHRLVGKFARAPDGTIGNVARVVRSRFGELSILEGSNERAWQVNALVVLSRG